MTKQLEFARNELNKGQTGNVAYALVGEHVFFTQGAYCFGEMRNPLETLRHTPYPRELPGEDHRGFRATAYVRCVQGSLDYIVLRLRSDCRQCYHIPEGDEAPRYWKIVELFLEVFEPCLLPETFSKRVADGLVIDTSKITPHGLGQLLVGYRNLYEKQRWRDIEILMKQGYDFLTSYNISMFFHNNFATDQRGILQEWWVPATDAHTVVDCWNYDLTPEILVNTIKDKFHLDSARLFDAPSYRDNTVCWFIGKDWRNHYPFENWHRGMWADDVETPQVVEWIPASGVFTNTWGANRKISTTNDLITWLSSRGIVK